MDEIENSLHSIQGTWRALFSSFYKERVLYIRPSRFFHFSFPLSLFFFLRARSFYYARIEVRTCNGTRSVHSSFRLVCVPFLFLFRADRWLRSSQVLFLFLPLFTRCVCVSYALPLRISCPFFFLLESDGRMACSSLRTQTVILIESVLFRKTKKKT